MGDPDAVEVIVADNGSTDRTAVIARDAGCRLAVTPVRRIGAVRNAGAAIARGPILCFIDADSQVHPDSFQAVIRALASTKVVGGTSGVRLERWSAGIAATYALLVPMVWITGFDIGVVFLRTPDFRAIGGYDESMLFAEDVVFLLALRRHGRRTGRRLIRLRRIKAVASTRKFDEHGEWHYFSMMARAGLEVLRPGSAEAFADRYWYRPRR